ncbi:MULTISPECIES: alpha/beta fold hydrolase [Bacillaceae]|uniref:Alpha/beta fold hydrolase n=1 Tax=Evansella alkalicola TaxID=745819 RepID=A0ABS6JUV7_9BACI|nr:MULTISPECIES: alpha/beta fold hydrolase [Bacillaceae]MBU9722047.1 alpha/beta fold hydrolase [Bacillus alkalicola]
MRWKYNVLYMILLLYTFLLFSACSFLDKGDPEILGQEVITLYSEGEFENAYKNYFSNSWKDANTPEEMESEWTDHTSEMGDFIGVNELISKESVNSSYVVEVAVEYTDIIFDVRLIMNKDYKITNLHMDQGIVNAVMPDSIIEEEVKIGEGTEFELMGTLTLPNNSDVSFPVAVIVHGSGPIDRDGTAYSYKAYRDIAWGLAGRGVGVLRYDKRTYVYGGLMHEQGLTSITIREEVIDDALAALDLLKNDSRIDSEQLYLIGHSLGGMLAPKISLEYDNLSGMIMMAGSPRSLWDIIYDQNINILNTGIYDEEEREILREQLELEREKSIVLLEEAKEEKLMNETIFGLPATYMYDLEQYKPSEIVDDLKIPMFVLQGEDDFQVLKEADFNKWQSLLGENELATLKSYPGLNHFFIEYDGLGKGTIEEYDIPNTVDEEVINDISQWILK